MSLRAQTPARKRKDKKKSLFCKSCTKQGFLGVKKEEVHNAGEDNVKLATEKNINVNFLEK